MVALSDGSDVYEGPRDFDSLLAFADDNLSPSCSAATLDVCDEEQKAILNKYLAMSAAERKAIVDDVDKSIADLEENFKAGVAKLQSTFTKLQQEKDDILKSVNSKDLQLLRTIR